MLYTRSIAELRPPGIIESIGPKKRSVLIQRGHLKTAATAASSIVDPRQATVEQEGQPSSPRSTSTLGRSEFERLWRLDLKDTRQRLPTKQTDGQQEQWTALQDFAEEARLLDRAFAEPAVEIRDNCGGQCVTEEFVKGRRKQSGSLRDKAHSNASHQSPSSGQAAHVVSALTQDGSAADRRRLRRERWQRKVDSRALPRGGAAARAARALQIDADQAGDIADGGTLGPCQHLWHDSHLLKDETAAAQGARGGDTKTALQILMGKQSIRLSRAEEVELVGVMQQGLRLEAQMQKLQAERRRRLDEPEIAAAVGLTPKQVSAQLTSGWRAKHALVHANKRLVFKAAHRFGWEPNFTLEDRVMAGMEGLMNGLVRFEVEYGTKLGTYLLYWIRQSISAAISTCGRLIQVPRHHEEAILQLRKQRSRLQTCLQRDPTRRELVEASKLAEKEVDLALLLERRQQVHWTDLGALQQEGSSQGLHGISKEDAVDSLLHDSGNRNDDRLLKAAALQQSLDGALATLPSRHAAVMRCLYDPERRKAPVQREVGSACGYTARRVGQIQKQCLKDLQQRFGDELRLIESID